MIIIVLYTIWHQFEREMCSYCNDFSVFVLSIRSVHTLDCKVGKWMQLLCATYSWMCNRSQPELSGLTQTHQRQRKRTRISIKKCFLFCILFSFSFCLFCTFYSTYWFRKWSCSIWHRCPYPTIRKCDVQRRRANRQHNNEQRCSAPSLISLLHLDHYCHIIHCVNSTSKWVFSASINKTQRKTQDDERTKETSLKAICNLFKRILFM